MINKNELKIKSDEQNFVQTDVDHIFEDKDGFIVGPIIHPAVIPLPVNIKAVSHYI